MTTFGYNLILITLLFSVKVGSAVPILFAPVIIETTNALLASALALYTAKQLSELDYQGLRSEILDAVENQSGDQLNLLASKLNSALMKAKRTGVSDSSTSCANEIKTSSKADGDCPPENRSNPQQCCTDFLKKFKKENKLNKINQNSYSVLDRKGNELCCLEWDAIHGRFEVFHLSDGSGSLKLPSRSREGRGFHRFQHLGERSCANPSDLNIDDLCNPSHPDKADPTGRHFPRQGCFKR